MVEILVPPSDIEEIKAEIAKIDARIKFLDEAVEFYKKLLYGAPAQMLYSPEELEAAPYLKSEQRELFPPVIGALQRDEVYKNLLFDPSRGIQPTIVDKYETERKALDGKYADFGPGSSFDEDLIQTSGADRTPPLFELPDLMNPVHPPSSYLLFGGSSYASDHEVAELTIELSKISFLLTPHCQLHPLPSDCKNARSDLIDSLLARYNPAGPSGFLVIQQQALEANPDLPAFSSDPLAAVMAEKARVDVFRVALQAIPPDDPVPPDLLMSNQAAAMARKDFVMNVRIPEMDSFLQTSPGYYNTRYSILCRRIAGRGTVHEVRFYRQVIEEAPAEKAELMAQRSFLESLIP